MLKFIVYFELLWHNMRVSHAYLNLYLLKRSI